MEPDRSTVEGTWTKVIDGARRRILDGIAALGGALPFLAGWVLYVAVKRLSRYRERDPSLWVFGARDGEAFVDNAKYLFLHVAAERPEVRPVWLTKDRKVAATLRAAGYEAYHCYSLRGLLLNLRAGVVFLTQGHRDVAMPCCGGATTVLLWHGVPLKTVSWDANFADESAAMRAARDYMSGEFDLLTVPGEALVEPFRSGLRIGRDRMLVAGYPRTDALFDDVPGALLGTDEAALARVERLAADHPVVFYLPTFRADAERSPVRHLDFDPLEEFLDRHDAYLVVKTHPKDDAAVPRTYDRVVELPERTDVYPFLRHADVLVTDYSSAYFDYLLLDRPVVFYPYDRERYRSERGFYFDYDAVTPGPVAREFDELLDGIERALDGDPHAVRRREVREALLDGAATDGRQSSVVYETIRRRVS